jgi:hypothetical protein
MSYVIKKGSKYVSRPGLHEAYTRDIRCIRVFDTESHAKLNCCDNEHIVKLESIFV